MTARTDLDARTQSTAVMARRHEALDSLDDFPSTPWSWRALFECVLPQLGFPKYVQEAWTAWEPACNRGLTAEVAKEYCGTVFASDVHPYGYGAVGSYVGQGLDVAPTPPALDLVVTNPPFRLATEFLARALKEAEVVALLLRTAWLEGGERYNEIFSKTPPTAVAVFSERVPMVKGRWDPEASTATSYSWFVWVRGASVETRLLWIPPGQRQRLTRFDDVARFAGGGE